jgi:hypothetical protein
MGTYRAKPGLKTIAILTTECEGDWNPTPPRPGLIRRLMPRLIQHNYLTTRWLNNLAREGECYAAAHAHPVHDP